MDDALEAWIGQSANSANDAMRVDNSSLSAMSAWCQMRVAVVATRFDAATSRSAASR
jgi:hypothetical protein